MKVAIFGSREISVDNIGEYLPNGTNEIVTGGARGIDACALEYAKSKGIKLTIFFPEYQIYGKGAPLKRNEKIVLYADQGIAFWDGSSRGTKYTIDLFLQLGKRIKIITVKNKSTE